MKIWGLPSYILFFRSKIRLGEHDTEHDGPDCQNGMVRRCNLGVQDFDIGKIIVHESYNYPHTFQNDIALIKLKGQVSQNGKFFKFASDMIIWINNETYYKMLRSKYSNPRICKTYLSSLWRQVRWRLSKGWVRWKNWGLCCWLGSYWRKRYYC